VLDRGLAGLLEAGRMVVVVISVSGGSDAAAVCRMGGLERADALAVAVA